MRIVIVESPDTLAVAAADVVASVVRARADAILGLPSGETPLGLYRDLARRIEAGDLDLSRATAFALDEFYGVTAGAPGTNAAYFGGQLALSLRARDMLRSDAPDPHEECARFAAVLRELGPPDLVILGIGTNGHIAFNEPGSPFDSRTRLVTLTDETRRVHAEVADRAAAVDLQRYEGARPSA